MGPEGQGTFWLQAPGWRTVARIEAALPLMMAREILCLKNSVSPLSPVLAVIRRPSSAMNLLVDLPNTPVVSTATGSKRCLVVMPE